MSISIIAAIAKNNTIGKNNELLWKIPLDMKHFKDTTTGHTIIMGKKTFESIGRLLPNRKNIIITRDDKYKFEGAEIYNSLKEVVDKYKNTEEEVFVIGGGEIYKQAINDASKLYITHVDESFEGDTFFPEIKNEFWEKESSQEFEASTDNPYSFSFVNYKRIKQS